jgi:hypothetical protein
VRDEPVRYGAAKRDRQPAPVAQAAAGTPGKRKQHYKHKMYSVLLLIVDRVWFRSIPILLQQDGREKNFNIF